MLVVLLALEGNAEQLAGIEQNLQFLLTKPATPCGWVHHYSLLQDSAAWRLRVS